jgi:hypothetical protein
MNIGEVIIDITNQTDIEKKKVIHYLSSNPIEYDRLNKRETENS